MSQSRSQSESLSQSESSSSSQKYEGSEVALPETGTATSTDMFVAGASALLAGIAVLGRRKKRMRINLSKSFYFWPQMNLGFENNESKSRKRFAFFLVKINYERIVKYIEND